MPPIDQMPPAPGDHTALIMIVVVIAFFLCLGYVLARIAKLSDRRIKRMVDPEHSDSWEAEDV